MVLICSINEAGVFTGRTATIGEADGCPAGWVRADAPSVPDGKVARWDGGAFAFSDAPDPLPSLRAEASATVMTMRDARIVGGLTFQGVRYQTRDGDRENIAGAAQLAFMAIVAGAKAGDLRWADPARDFAWIAEDNGTVTMDAPTVVAFGKAAAAFKQACIFAAFTLKGAIETAPDTAALAAIRMEEGWPL